MPNWFLLIKIMHISASESTALFMIQLQEISVFVRTLKESKVCSHQMENLVKITRIIMAGCSKEIIYIEFKTQ